MRLQTLYEARWIFAVLAVLTLVSLLFSGWFFLVCLGLIAYTFFFFRDPERSPPDDPCAVVAAADGVVAEIAQLEETEVVKQMMQRVAIFLSVFDVHINRVPIDGRVIYRLRREGRCLDARNPECSAKNAAVTWAFENPRATIIVRQITGAIARRIVAWSEMGEDLKKGERFGMIRFGSRTEVYLPLNATITVRVGDHVRGGSTIIARLPS
jgi:phosphatidylserine decarboxylase